MFVSEMEKSRTNLGVENEREEFTLNTGLDICLARARVVMVSGSSLHLSGSSHSADANTSAIDIRPLGSGFSRLTMIVSASKIYSH
jgi:hypothetical protein